VTDLTKHPVNFVPDEGLDLPYAVENRPGFVIINLEPRALHDPHLSDPRSYRWIHGVRGHVTVDFTHVHMINSSCCGWLVNLVRMAKPANVSITGANGRVAETLRILRLDVLMTVVKDPAHSHGQHQRPRPPSGTGDQGGMD
jgi:hypothetical protein